MAIAAIRDSAAALQNTKLFSKVQVSITPGAAGVEVLFIRQPTSYIGILDFPGATRVFTCILELLQTPNIPEQSPYVSERCRRRGLRRFSPFFWRMDTSTRQ